MRKAFLSLGPSPRPRPRSPRASASARTRSAPPYVPIETVQDIVQEELVLAGHMRVAERYIVYRAERALLRAREAAAGGAAGDPGLRPTARVEWTGADLRERIAFASIGLDLDSTPTSSSASCAARSGPAIARADLQRLVILNAKALDRARQRLLARSPAASCSTYIYEETLGWDIVARRRSAALRDAHRRALRRDAASTASTIGRIDPRLLDYDLDRLAAALDPPPDLDFDFLGMQTLYDRYLIVDKTGAAAAPDRGAAALLDARGDGRLPRRAGRRARRTRALALYALYKSRRFCSSTPTLFNAGTLHSQLSSCYLYKIDDTLVLDRRARHRGERDVLEVGGRPRRLVDRGARHGRAHRVHQRRVARASSRSSSCTTTSSSPSTRAASARAPAAPTSRPGTTTSASSSSCGATPATSAGARTT